MPKKQVLCFHGGTCKAPAVEWRFVSFATMKNYGVVNPYCKKHVIEADFMGAKGISSYYLPVLGPKKKKTKTKKTRGINVK